MKHRGDIDGLRALAIIPVIIFHYQHRVVQDGFLGVDIFFVISGFLITKIISSEIDARRFSIQRFYVRRIRRIFPALFAVLAVVIAAGAVLLLPNEFADLGKSIVATTLFVSNIYFFKTDSYFGPASEHEPLLHTWSLAVEEQFYLAFPIVLLLLRRGSKRLTAVTLSIAVLASFALNVWLLETDITGAFYLPLPRAWELLTGSVLALGIVPAVASRPMREIIGALGLALILIAVNLSLTTNQTIVPLAAAPCAGAALLILAGFEGGSYATRILEWPVLGYIGRISYSLYLWHWPIFVIYSLVAGPDARAVMALVPVAVTIVASVLSERYIERPFRKPATPGAHAPVFRVAAAAMATSVVLGLVLVFGRGLPARFPASVDALASYIQYGAAPYFRPGTCFLDPLQTSDSFATFAATTCLKTDARRKNVLLFGDSHAAQLWIGLSQAYPGINFMQATVSGCKPLLAPAAAVERTEFGACRDMMRYVFRTYLPAHHLDGVIIDAYWSDADLPALIDTIRYVRQLEATIVVVGPIVEYREALPRILALGKLRGEPNLARDERVASTAPLDARMRAAVAAKGVAYLSIYRTICPANECRTTLDSGVPLQFDYGHLTRDGSLWVGAQWAAAGDLRLR